jgi:hypothetical protein
MNQTSNTTPQPVLPNATAVLVLGILYIVVGCMTLGLILGIIGLALSKEGRIAYARNPEGYSGYGMLNAGRVLCIIGIVLGSISVFYVIIVLAIGGAVLGSLAEIFTW